MSLFRKGTSRSSKSTAASASILSDSCFTFSASGSVLLFWGDQTRLLRFDLSLEDASVVRSCRYDVEGVEQAAAGDRCCAVIASNERGRQLYFFRDLASSPHAVTSLESHRGHVVPCLTVSRDDKYVACSLGTSVRLYLANLSGLHQVTLEGQMQSYMGLSQQHAAIDSVQRNPSKKHLNQRELEQEIRGQQTVVGRQIGFSINSRQMIVATQIADQQIHLDVWECRNESWETGPDLSHGVQLPRYTTNDGDITSVFYDSISRSAFLTAYISKEYPVWIQIPRSSFTRPEPWGFRVVHATQAPSGSRFVTVNGRNEIHIFNCSSDGMLIPNRLKRSPHKIPSNAFKPGRIALSMPHPNILRIFWIKEGALPSLRTVVLGEKEQIHDIELGQQFEELLRGESAAIELPTSTIQSMELDSAHLVELESSPIQELENSQIRELADTQIQELPGSKH